MTDYEIGLLVDDLRKHGNAYVTGPLATKATARRVKDMARAEGLRVHYATSTTGNGSRHCILEVVPS
jgi:hypothetical protein